MATSSRSRPSATAPHNSRGPTALPPYQPLSNPLNPEAIRALQSLTRTYPLNPVTKRQETAVASLTNIAADINERYTARASNHERQTAKRAEQGAPEDEDRAQKFGKMRQDTKEMTSKMEAALRGVIDSKAQVEGIETALRELDTNVREGGGRLATTQSTLGASQYRAQKRQRLNADDEEGSLDDDDEPTQTQKEGPTSFLQRKLEASAADYENLSLKNKYASNNDYVGFRKIIHDAQHPGDDAPPMPHASTWFPSSDTGAVAVEASDDEDLQVASEKRSIKCPLTLRPMKEPVTSTKCPHSFEKEAIYDMLALSSLSVSAVGDVQTQAPSGRRSEKAIKCPVCSVVLTAQNLKADAAMLRKIRRIQEAEQEKQDEDSDPEPVRRVKGTQKQHIGSSPGPPAMSQTQRIKKEMAEARSRGVSMVPGTQLEGEGEEDSYEMVGETQIEGSEEEEEEEEEEEPDVVSMEDDDGEAEDE